jgi:hypothetical protein
VLKNTLRVISAAALLMWAGTALAQDVVIGDAGTETVNNTNATDNVSGNLILGNQSSGNGTYTITGNSAQTNVSFVSGGNGVNITTGLSNPNGALIVGNGGTGSFTQGLVDQSDSGNVVNVAGDLVLGHLSGSVGTYVLNSGTLNVGGQVAVGGSSTGLNSFTQNGGTLNLTNLANASPTDYVSVASGSWGGALAIGGGVSNGDQSNSGGTGTYTLNNGAINTYNLLVGPSGTGIMNQNGGAVTTTFLTAGFSGTGTYNLSGTGTINAYSEDMGYAGTGIFNQSGGTNTIATTLEVGQQYSTNSPGYGAYNLTGGTLTTGGNTTIGDGEQGDFVNTNAVHNVSGNLIVGEQNTSGVGTYTITGNSAQTNVNFFPGGKGIVPGSISVDNPNGIANPNGALIVGNAGIGTFTQGNGLDTGNQVNVAGDLVLGLQSGSTGTYTINSGTLTVGGAMVIGSVSTNNNVFNQNGGIVNLTGSASGNPDYGLSNPNAIGFTSPGNLYVGGETVYDSGVGTYNLTAGQLNASSIAIGWSGTGTFNQSGGSVVGSYLDLGDCGGCNGGNSAGFYNLTGNGTLTTHGDESIGDFGHGEFLQNGAGTQNTVTGTLWIGNGAAATPNGANPGNYDRSGLYTLEAGTLSTQYTVVGSSGTGTFIQTGGIHEVSNTLTIGQQNPQPLSGPVGTGTASNPIFGGPAPGVYTMTGGILTVGGDPTSNAGIIVGDAGNGTFNQIAGSVTSGVLIGQRGNLVIGAQAGSTGTYNLGNSTSQAPTLQVYGDLILGRDAAGSVTVPDPASTATDPLPPITVLLNAASGSLTIAGNGTVMNVYGDAVIGGSGIGAFNQSGGVATVAGTVTVGANGSATLTGGSLAAGTFNNAGTVNLGSLGSLIVGSGGYNQSAGLTQGLGTINGAVTVSGGIMRPGFVNAPGMLTINGNYTQNGGTFLESIVGTGNGLLSVNGIVSLQDLSSLGIEFSGSANPLGQDYTIMTFASLASNSLFYVNGTAEANGAIFADDGYNWKLDYNATNIVLELQPSTGPSPTPEPSTLIMMGSGLASLLAAYRGQMRA